MIAALAFALALGACGRTPAAGGIACYPDAARRWIHRTADASQPAPPTTVRQATVYVDRSGSMAGYVAADPIRRPFVDLIGMIPQPLRAAGATTSFRAFGRTISPAMSDPRAMQTRDFYRCAQANLSTCQNQESRLDQVFARIRDTPGEMAVVLTDLWFTNSDIQTTGLTALQPMLSQILQGGRTVAVYGLAAPFDGRISDLPGTKGGIAYRGTHPLFMLVVGPKEQVVALDTQLREASGSRQIAADLASGAIRHSVFTVDPGPIAAAEKAPFERGADPAFVQRPLEPTPGVVLQQFALTRRPPRPPGEAAPQAASWTGPKAASFLADAVWQGPVEAQTRTWLRMDEQCAPASWVELGASDDGWEEAGAGRYRLTLRPDRLGTRLTKPGATYLVLGELRRTSVLSPNPVNAWMRAWSLAPEAAAAAAAAPPGLFPTLNLDEVARLMEGALRTAARKAHEDPKRRDAVAGFGVLVRVEG